MKKIFSLSTAGVFWALALLGFLVYSNTFKSSFQCDDFYTIVGNQAIRHLSDLNTIWQAFNTRFVVGLTLAFNYALGKENVMGYHLFNIFIHILNSFLVYELTCLSLQTPRMSKSSLNPGLIGFLTALVFLSHPLQTQGVTYIWQRATSLASFFYIGALVFYVKSRLKASWVYYVLCLLLTVLGMFTKEIVFTLPFAILLYEFIFLRELSSPKSLIGDQSGFDSRLKHSGMTLLLPLLLTLFMIPWTMTQANEKTLSIVRPHSARIHHANPLDNFLQMTRTVDSGKISRMEFILTQVNVLRTYLRLFILPFHQNIDYDYPKARSLTEPHTFLSFLLLAGLFSASLLLLKKHPLPAFGILWFFLTLSVESLVAQEEFIFEHRLYLPMAGFGLFVVMGIAYLFKNKPRRISLILLGIVACHSFLTYQRNFVWRDELTLWDDAVRKSPKKARVYNGRGTIYEKKYLLDQALSDFKKAIELEPNYADAYGNRGSVYQKKGLLDQALLDCNRAIELNPAFAQAYNTRGSVYKNKDRLDQALLDFNKTIALEPDYAQAYSNRSSVYEKKNLLDQAFADSNRAIELDPGLAEAYNNRGYIYEKKGLLDQALADYNKAIKMKPGLVSFYSNRASIYLKKGLLNEALADCEKIIEMDPGSARAYRNRAVVYSLKKEEEKSRRDMATAKALELKSSGR